MPLLPSNGAFLLAPPVKAPQQTAPEHHFTAGLPPSNTTPNFPSSAPHLHRPGAEQTRLRQRTKPKLACQKKQPPQHSHLSVFIFNSTRGKGLILTGCCFALSTAARWQAAPALQKGKTQAVAVGRLETRQQVYIAAWISQ